MAGFISNALGYLGNQFGAMGQVYGAQKNAQTAANQANQTYQTAQNAGANVGYQFPTANAQQASQSALVKPPSFSSYGLTQNTGTMNGLQSRNSPNPAPGNQSGGTSSGTIDYTLHPGESIDAYNSRVNTAGNIATATGTPQTAPNAGAYTYSGGVNSQGQTFPGYNAGQVPPGSNTPVPPEGTTSQGNGVYYDINGNPIGNIPQTPQGANTITTPYTPKNMTYAGLVSNLANIGAQPSAGYTQAQQTANDALLKLQQNRQQEAQTLANSEGLPGTIEFKQGKGQVLQNQYLAYQNALANTYQGAVGLAGAATSQQQAQQAGVGAAAGLAAPQQAGPTNVPFYPTQGNYGAPAYGAYGQGGLQQVGNIGGQIAVGQNIAQLNSQLGGAQVEGTTLQELIGKAGINPSDVTFMNALTQYLQTGVLSDPKYNEFAGQVNSFIQSMAPILGAAGSATDFKTQLAQQIVNARSSGKSMNDVIGYFLNLAKQKIQGMSTGGGAGIGSNETPVGTSGGTTFGNFFGQ